MTRKMMTMLVLTLAVGCSNDKSDKNAAPATESTRPVEAPAKAVDAPKPKPEPKAAPAPDPDMDDVASERAASIEESKGASDEDACEAYVATLVRCGADDAFLKAAFANGATWPVEVSKADWKKELATFKKYEASRICSEFGAAADSKWPFSNVSDDEVSTVLLAEKDCASVGAAIHASGLPVLNGD